MKIDWSKQVTQEQIDAYRKTLEKERVCLRCSKKFLSEWKGNRTCSSCIKEDDNALFSSEDSGVGDCNSVEIIF